MLTGQPRHYVKGYEYIRKHIIEPNLKLGVEIDIFLHFWFNTVDIGKNAYSYISDTAKMNNYTNDVISSNTPSNIISLYNPVVSSYDEQVDCTKFIKKEYDTRRNHCSPFSTISQYLSLVEVVKLVSKHEEENNIYTL